MKVLKHLYLIKSSFLVFYLLYFEIENDESLQDDNGLSVSAYDSTDENNLIFDETEIDTKSLNSNKKLTILNLSNENLQSLNEGKLNVESNDNNSLTSDIGVDEEVRSNIDEKDIFDTESAREENDQDVERSNSLVGKFNGFHVNTARISLTEFTKRVSDVDKAALSRRPTGYYESDSNDLYENVNDEITMKLTENQIAEMG